MGEVPCRGHIGEQDEAARLFLHTSDAFGVRSNSRLQPITVALIGRGLWELGRPRPYTGRSSTVTSTRW